MGDYLNINALTAGGQYYVTAGNTTATSITIDSAAWSGGYGSGTVTYSEPDEPEGDDSAVAWLDRRVEEMRVAL